MSLLPLTSVADSGLTTLATGNNATVRQNTGSQVSVSASVLTARPHAQPLATQSVLDHSATQTTRKGTTTLRIPFTQIAYMTPHALIEVLTGNPRAHVPSDSNRQRRVTPIRTERVAVPQRRVRLLKAPVPDVVWPRTRAVRHAILVQGRSATAMPNQTTIGS